MLVRVRAVDPSRRDSARQGDSYPPAVLTIATVELGPRPFSIVLSHASPFYQTLAEPEQPPVSTNLEGLIVCLSFFPS